MASFLMSSGTQVRVVLVALPFTLWGWEQFLKIQAPHVKVVGVASSVAEASLLLKQSQPDVLVVDLEGEDGTESIQDLHSQTAAKILVVTGRMEAFIHDSAVLAGARGVFTKNQAPAAFLRAIECVHAGEMWLDRGATGRLFMELARLSKTKSKPNIHEASEILTSRERQIVAQIAGDASASGKVIADRLHISEHTLRNHLTSIYAKLGVKNRVELYAYAQRCGVDGAWN